MPINRLTGLFQAAIEQMPPERQTAARAALARLPANAPMGFLARLISGRAEFRGGLFSGERPVSDATANTGAQRRGFQGAGAPLSYNHRPVSEQIRGPVAGTDVAGRYDADWPRVLRATRRAQF